jgi:hypothetical protein
MGPLFLTAASLPSTMLMNIYIWTASIKGRARRDQLRSKVFDVVGHSDGKISFKNHEKIVEYGVHTQYTYCVVYTIWNKTKYTCFIEFRYP